MTTPSQPTSAVRPEPPKACPICQGDIERGSLSVHGTLLGFLTLLLGVKGLTIVVMVLTTVMVALFGRTPPELQHL